MLVLKNFIGYFSLKSGVYASFIWNLLLCVFFFIVAEESSLIVIIPEVYAGIIILFTIYTHPNSPSSYFVWVLSELLLMAIFVILFAICAIFYGIKDIIVIFPIFAILCASQIYYILITWSMYCSLEHQFGNGASPPAHVTSKGPTNKDVENLMVQNQPLDARSNRTLLPMQQAMVPSCPSSSSYYYAAPNIQLENPAGASVHHIPYPVQPAFNPELHSPTRFA